MKSKVLTIGICLIISTFAYAGFVYSFNCNRCGKVAQTQSHQFQNYPTKPSNYGCVEIRKMDGLSPQHEWILTGFFETK